jgi:nitroreductase
MDIGMFMQNVMLAAIGFGLATCPQAALAEYPDIIREELALPEGKLVVSGMALGYPDMTQAINQYRTAREAPSVFVQHFS